MTREGRQARELREHRERGVAVHLFVRRGKLLQGRAAPFVYCGEVDFVDWEGDSPVTIRWRLGASLPPRPRELLAAPDGPAASDR